MPTIIDSLLIELGFDTKALSKGQKEAVDSLNKLESSSNKTSKEMENHNKKLGESVGKVRNQVLGLLAAFTAGAGMKSFFQSMTNTDAAAGRLAKNIGMSVEQFTAWQNVAARAGGSAEGIAGTMQGLTQQFQELALTGQSSVIPYFRAVGVAIADVTTGKMRPLNDILLDLSDKFSRMDPAKAQALGRGMGIDEGTINVLLKGRVAVTDLLREQERLGYANKQDTQEAIRRQQALAGLKQVSEDLGRKMLTLLTPAILAATAALTKLGQWFRDNPKVATAVIGTLTAAVVALSASLAVGAVSALAAVGVAGVATFASLTIAAAPFLLAIGAIAAGVYGVTKGLDWLKTRKGFQTGDFTAEGAWGAGDMKLPRGIRNNNPGNLNYAGQAGATKEEGPNGRFAVFKTMSEGIVALANQLKLFSSRGIDTITKIIGKYAPPNENNTQAYIDTLARKMGIDPNAKLNLQDQATMRAMIDGISTIENGKGHINLDQINEALSGQRTLGSSSSSAHAETHIGQINVTTQATDAKGIARGIGKEVEKYQNMAAMANYGLA